MDIQPHSMKISGPDVEVRFRDAENKPAGTFRITQRFDPRLNWGSSVTPKEVEELSRQSLDFVNARSSWFVCEEEAR
jgi:hypothetical protein